jgi:Tol biopolymer transport system component
MRPSTALVVVLGLLGCGDDNGGGDGGGGGPDAGEPQQSITVTVTGFGEGAVLSDVGGIDCSRDGGTCEADVPVGADVVLTAEPTEGYLFNGWIGAGCARRVPTCSVTADEAVEVSASFVTLLWDSSQALDFDGPPLTASNIWSSLTDGSEATPLTTITADTVFAYGAVWSPDGERIAFVSDQKLDGADEPNTNLVYNIWIMNGDGSEAAPLTELTAEDVHNDEPHWSPDGTRLLYSSNRAVNGTDALEPPPAGNVWVASADGSSDEAITDTGARTFEPRWSPDGEWIAYESRRPLAGAEAGQPMNVWLVRPDGSEDHSVTDLEVEGTDCLRVVFSPDGASLLFASPRARDGSDAPQGGGFTWNLFKVGVDGEDLVALTPFTADNAFADEPSFTPDGSRIYFNSSGALDGDDAGIMSRNLWVMDADGSNREPLTELTSVVTLRKPVVAPDGSYVFYQATRAPSGDDEPLETNAYNVWRMEPDGSNHVPVTELTATDEYAGRPDPGF